MLGLKVEGYVFGEEEEELREEEEREHDHQPRDQVAPVLGSFLNLRTTTSQKCGAVPRRARSKGA